MTTTLLEIELWASVQRAYAASRSYRAGDDPAVARALAEYQRAVFGERGSNVVPFRRGGRE